MDPTAPLPSPTVPIAHLESLKFKATQIIESIQALQRTIDPQPPAYNNVMPPWPDILSKFTILLSQTHHFSTALLPLGARTTSGAANKFENIALHPSTPMPDAQLDNTLIPLLRNQQTTDVLRLENSTVRRLAEHMDTRGSVGVLGLANPPGPTPAAAVDSTSAPTASPASAPRPGMGRRPEYGYENVLEECAQIRRAHDQRVERAVRAVTMLRERFEWRQRVEVEVEEPEELEWDPRLGAGVGGHSRVGEGGVAGNGDGDGDGDGDVGMESGEGEGGQSSDEDEVEGELVELTRVGEGEGMSSPAALQDLFSFGDADGDGDGMLPAINAV